MSMDTGALEARREIDLIELRILLWFMQNGVDIEKGKTFLKQFLSIGEG